MLIHSTIDKPLPTYKGQVHSFWSFKLYFLSLIRFKKLQVLFTSKA